MTTYGTPCHAPEVERFLDQLLGPTFDGRLSEGEHPVPVCIWGLHGIGKTELVQAFAFKRSAQLVEIAPAQFEEMGDLLGMPRIAGDQSVAKTELVPPAWVPRDPGPGILLIDDLNRADDRILRGLMPLLGQGRLVNWALPEGWHIVCTANPDSGDYSVTPLDEAMVTRMLHVHMQFEVRAWTRWAKTAGVWSTGIAFVEAHPELVDQGRTTARSLTQVFHQLARLDKPEADLPMVKMLADAGLEPRTSAALVTYLQKRALDLPGAEDILTDFDRADRRLRSFLQKQPERIDILGELCAQIPNVMSRKAGPSSTTSDNISRFILADYLPADLRFRLVRELANGGHEDILARPEIGAILLENL